MPSFAYRNGQQHFSSSYLERICPAPRPMRSMDDWNRLQHVDLDSLSDRDLLREGRLAQRRADLDCNPDNRAWFEQRVHAVNQEVRRRRAELTTEFRRLQGGRR